MSLPNSIDRDSDWQSWSFRIGAPFILDPAKGSFSIFAWVKGGAPWQAFISEEGAANWLCADAVEGNLMTELRFIGGRLSEPPLVSQTVISDDAWHRVGLSWDGTNRSLYMDDIEVASDTQPGFATSEGGLYIGTGKEMALGTHWSGLIDEVRTGKKIMVIEEGTMAGWLYRNLRSKVDEFVVFSCYTRRIFMGSRTRSSR